MKRSVTHAVVALELDPARLAKVAENAERLDLNLTLVCGDASAPVARAAESEEKVLPEVPILPMLLLLALT